MIPLNKQRLLGLGLGLASLVAFAACDNAPPAGGGGGQAPVGITKFERPGPNAVRTMGVGGCTLFLGPTTGAPKPGMGWANGTGGQPSTYTGLLTRVASFGVQVVAANTAQSGTGTQTSTCINTLATGNFNVDGRFCVSGHSQGGSGAVNASRLNARVVCTIPVQPDNRFTAQSNGRDIDGPALVLCGGADNLAPCGAPTAGTNGSGLYNQATVPITQITVIGAPHTGNGSPTGNGGLYSALVTAQTQAVLLNDADARAALFGPNPTAAQDPRLSGVRSKNF